MSREDPQFKLRMPVQLRAQAEQAARVSGRSLNAELVARLESTFLGEPTSSSLIPALRAKELALMARSAIPDEVRRRAIESIARAVRLGHREASVSLGDLHLDVSIPEVELENLLQGVFDELESAGYKVSWGDITYLRIEF
ncbi:MAG: Arc family DNA-binding protein [Pseudomonas stutzeri]|uniref:Arc family DNA-binding protein n=1 Tax=Stutzerimonas stutzeri TaxID=316 RepID=UPI0014293822|nr:Arc family DNA-binding protein [Stutzerimonas stutzeri]MDH0121031.1 Arc family DNA-binding protein [Stutzerimonas stutzeri]MTI91156.1 Arc family DNA-binding protein [Stutzerimonas stutzeri]